VGPVQAIAVGPVQTIVLTPLALPNHAGTGASDQLRGAVLLPPKQARAPGASRLSLLVEAVAQITHGSGASICDGTTHAESARKSADKWDEALARAADRDTSPTIQVPKLFGPLCATASVPSGRLDVGRRDARWHAGSESGVTLSRGACSSSAGASDPSAPFVLPRRASPRRFARAASTCLPPGVSSAGRARRCAPCRRARRSLARAGGRRSWRRARRAGRPSSSSTPARWVSSSSMWSSISPRRRRASSIVSVASAVASSRVRRASSSTLARTCLA
jgi:hypothetical protein